MCVHRLLLRSSDAQDADLMTHRMDIVLNRLFATPVYIYIHGQSY
jgi:hypothetical protein